MTGIKTLRNTPYYELADGTLVLATLAVDSSGAPSSGGGGGESGTYTGNKTITGNLSVGGNVVIGSDVTLSRLSAGTLRFGADANATPVSYTLRIGESGSGTNIAGGNATIASGAGTGTGTASSIIFQTPTVGSTGTTAQTLATRLTVQAGFFAGSAHLALPTNSSIGPAAAGQSNGNIFFNANGAIELRSSGAGVQVEGPGGLDLIYGSGHTRLVADNAGDTLALRASTTAQTFRVYNTYTDASNYERASIKWDTNQLVIGPENAGTGITRYTTLNLAGDGSAYIKSPGGNYIQIIGGNTNLLTMVPNYYSVVSAWSSNYAGFKAADAGVGNLNRIGTDFNILSGEGTGSGAPGSIIFKTTSAEASGTSLQTLVTRLTISDSATLSYVPIYTNTNVSILSGGSFIVVNDSSVYGAGTIRLNTDTYILRDAANTVALRNDANAQTLRVYNTYTDASNYSRLAIQGLGGNDWLLRSEGAGTGGQGVLLADFSTIQFRTANLVQWTFSPTSMLGSGTKDFYIGDSALATNATVGFLGVNSCAGVPSGTPAGVPTGQVPMVLDSTDGRIYFYYGSAWHYAALT